MQKALLPVRYLTITTGMYELSHAGKPAIDFAWWTEENKKLYAPFNGVVKKFYEPSNGIFLESKEPVLWADGTYDYMTVFMGHLEDIGNVYVGREYNQNEYMGKMGNKGNSAGSHLHLEVSAGKFYGDGWYYVPEYDNWRVNNGVEPPTALMYSNDTQLGGDTRYDWKKESDVHEDKYVGTPVPRNENVDQIEVYVDMLNCRKEPSIKAEIEGYANLGIYNVCGYAEADGYAWYSIEPNRWVAHNESWEHLYPKKEQPQPNPEPTPEPTPQPDDKDKKIEELEKENQELKDKVSLLEKENKALKEEIEELKKQDDYKFTYIAEHDGFYKIKLYKDETLIIK